MTFNVDADMDCWGGNIKIDGLPDLTKEVLISLIEDGYIGLKFEIEDIPYEQLDVDSFKETNLESTSDTCFTLGLNYMIDGNDLLILRSARSQFTDLWKKTKQNGYEIVFTIKDWKNKVVDLLDYDSITDLNSDFDDDDKCFYLTEEECHFEYLEDALAIFGIELDKLPLDIQKKLNEAFKEYDTAL